MFFSSRHPIPDYYTVTLETLRDRTTRARTEQCTAEKYENDSPSGASCPPGVNVGDSYVRRLVNESCEKTVHFLMYFQIASVNIALSAWLAIEQKDNCFAIYIVLPAELACTVIIMHA